MLLIAGLFCIIAPTWIMSASGMGELEEEGCLVWGIRLFGVALIGVSVWLIFHRP